MDVGIGLASASGQIVLSLSGVLDGETLALVHSALRAAIDHGGNRISVDASGVTAIDEATLDAVRSAQRSLEGDRSLRLVRPSRAVRALLHEDDELSRRPARPTRGTRRADPR